MGAYVMFRAMFCYLLTDKNRIDSSLDKIIFSVHGSTFFLFQPHCQTACKIKYIFKFMMIWQHSNCPDAIDSVVTIKNNLAIVFRYVMNISLQNI